MAVVSPMIFVPHPEGVHEILGGDEAQAFMEQACTILAGNVMANVPAKHGTYQKAFGPSVVTSVEVEGEAGAVGYVGTTLGLYGLTEFGTINYPGGYHPFGLGAQQSGLTWEPAGRP